MNRCAHEICHCTDADYEVDGRKFCSAACAEVGNTALVARCPCGHPECTSSEG